MKAKPITRKRAKMFGFSLLELMVVMFLLAGLVMIALPALRTLTSFDLKHEVTRMAGLSREVYAMAALLGNTHRIVLDMDNNEFWVEEKETSEQLIQPDLGYEELMKALIENNQSGSDDATYKSYVPVFKKKAGSLGEKKKLKKGIIFYGAWTEQMNEVVRSGRVYFYFFSGGYTQTAFVSLAIAGDEEHSAMFLSLNPLTGAVKIDFGEPSIEELLSDEGGTGT